MGYQFTIILILLQSLSAYWRNWYFFKTGELGVTIRKGLSLAIYNKILKFNESSKHKASAGKLVSIISGELQAIEKGMIMIPSLISSPALFIVVVALTGIYFKGAVVIGAILGLIVFTFQYIAARKIKTYKYLEGVHSEKRLRIISDIINGIRTIKVYAWEIPFSKLVNKFR